MTDENTSTETTTNEPDHDAIETEARQYGWSGRDKWRGDDASFVEAPEFLRRAKEHLPVVNSLLAKERQRVGELERKQREYDANVQDLQKRLKAQDATHAKMLELQRVELMNRYDGEKRQALAIEDPAKRQQAYDAAQKREVEAIRGFVAAEKPIPDPVEQPRQQQGPQYNPDAKARGEAWLANEPWLKDPATLAAAGTIQVPVELDFNVDPEGHLNYVKAEMEKRFPGVTGTSAQPARLNGTRQSSVEGTGSRGGSRTPKVKGYNELPSEAKSACERMISSKMVKTDPDAFKKSYAVNYWKEYGDE